MTSQNSVDPSVEPRSPLLPSFSGHAGGASSVEHDDLESDSSSLLQERRPVGSARTEDVRGEYTPDAPVTQRQLECIGTMRLDENAGLTLVSNTRRAAAL